MAACEAELTLTRDHLIHDRVVLARDAAETLVGVAHVSAGVEGCFLEKLFVDPPWMGQGVGALLYAWALQAAHELGAKELIIDSDPGAAGFYQRQGAVAAGTVPSGSIPGRRLPRFVHIVPAYGEGG